MWGPMTDRKMTILKTWKVENTKLMSDREYNTKITTSLIITTTTTSTVKHQQQQQTQQQHKSAELRKTFPIKRSNTTTQNIPYLIREQDDDGNKNLPIHLFYNIFSEYLIDDFEERPTGCLLIHSR